jgi:hypothetical protein
MESKKCVKLGLRILFLLSAISPLAANPLKGKFHPIGPGTDAGLYNEGFFEGDILPRMDVSIDNAVRTGFEFKFIEDGGFGGLVVSTLVSGTQDRGFAPDRSRRIFAAGKIHSMPSFGGEVK